MVGRVEKRRKWVGGTGEGWERSSKGTVNRPGFGDIQSSRRPPPDAAQPDAGLTVKNATFSLLLPRQCFEKSFGRVHSEASRTWKRSQSEIFSSTSTTFRGRRGSVPVPLFPVSQPIGYIDS